MPMLHEGFAPNLQKWINSLPSQPDPETSLEKLIPLLKRKQVHGAQDIATATAHVLGEIVDKSTWSDVDALLANVEHFGGRLMLAHRQVLVIGNIVRRVLGLIRAEATEDRNDQNPSEAPSEGVMTPVESAAPALSISTPERPVVRSLPSALALPRSLSHLLSATTLSDQEGQGSLRTSGASTPLQKGGVSSGKLNELRAEILNGIQEIIEEIDQEADQIGLQADAQIRPGDQVLLHHPGAACQRLILRLAQRRKFKVCIYEEKPKPTSEGDEKPHAAFRSKLKKAGCDSWIFWGNGCSAIMSQINRVFLEANAITGSGSAVTMLDGPDIAEAAKEENVPVFVLAGIYKFGPQIPFKEEDIVEYDAAPQQFWNSAFHGCGLGPAPTTALIRAKYIDQYISNIGCHPGSLIERIISDHYQEDDRNLHIKLLDEEKAQIRAGL